MLKINLVFTDCITIICALVIAFLLSDYTKLKENISNEAKLLNNTQHANQSFIIFNRVPKAGSETLWGLLDRLQYGNNFSSYSDSQEAKRIRGNENTLLDSDSRKYYVNMLLENSFSEELNMTLSAPFSYVKHLNFLNFEEFNQTNPIYINMVRHPVERVISWYYYARQNWYQFDYDPVKDETILKKSVMQPSRYKMTFEECVLAKWTECLYPPGATIHGAYSPYGGSHFSQIAFFCGHGPECDIFDSRKALEIAKYNVENYYSVVGILEKWQETLQVFESYLPAYFKDVRKVYKEYMNEKIVNSNNIKPKIPQYIKDRIAANFTMEIEFYEFCKQRFHKQLLAIQ